MSVPTSIAYSAIGTTITLLLGFDDRTPVSIVLDREQARILNHFISIEPLPVHADAGCQLHIESGVLVVREPSGDAIAVIPPNRYRKMHASLDLLLNV